MSGKLIAAHHSLADWDFEKGATSRNLDPNYFISAPTSLHFTTYPDATIDCILCRISETQLLPQGEVRTWLRRHTTNTSCGPAMFRNQAALGSSNSTNCYFLYMAYGAIILYRSINNVWSEEGSWTWAQPSDTWTHFRTFWYNGKTPGEEDALCVDLYREVSGQWVKMEGTKYDTANQWKDSEINRCGVLTYIRPYAESWFDDTEIWGPV